MSYVDCEKNPYRIDKNAHYFALMNPSVALASLLMLINMIGWTVKLLKIVIRSTMAIKLL